MTRPKDVLTGGAVRPWHVIFILLAAYVVAEVSAVKLTLPLDADLRGELFPLLNSALNAAMCVAFVVVVPEFRRALPLLFARPVETPRAGDLCWAFLAMLCWGYGLYPAGFLMPLMQCKPEWYSLMGFAETARPFDLRILAIAFTSVILAPIAEETMYRGFLMNLWIARWGTWAGVIASSIVFGLFHRQNALFAAMMGAGFALVYLRFDSLWPGIALHSAYNLLTFNWALGQVVSIRPRATIQDLANWIPEMIVAILFFPVAYIFWRRFRPAP
ncbi:MAG TPA: CPBP family intramembrane glutamic endopeptidase [Usitatibacter sp.]|nr:CPBP family intramembrane glutamic endopeptidase [Usitatibacter sp.]